MANGEDRAAVAPVKNKQTTRIMSSSKTYAIFIYHAGVSMKVQHSFGLYPGHAWLASTNGCQKTAPIPIPSVDFTCWYYERLSASQTMLVTRV